MLGKENGSDGEGKGGKPTYRAIDRGSMREVAKKIPAETCN